MSRKTRDSSPSRLWLLLAAGYYTPILLWLIALLTLPSGDPPARWHLRAATWGAWPALVLIFLAFAALTLLALGRPSRWVRCEGPSSLTLVGATYFLAFHYAWALLTVGWTGRGWISEASVWGGLALASGAFAGSTAHALRSFRDRQRRGSLSDALAVAAGLAGLMPLAVVLGTAIFVWLTGE